MMAPGSKRRALGRRPGKQYRRRVSTTKRPCLQQQSGSSYYVQHTDKDVMFVISGQSDDVHVIRPSRRSEEAAAAITTDSGWGTVMPLEILHWVFQLLADSEGAVPTLCRLSQVCRRWCQVASSPALWQRVSISHCWVVPVKKVPPNIQEKVKKTMEMLIEKRLSMMSEFSLHHWKNYVPFILQAVSTSCPLLTSLTLSHCSRVPTDGLLSVASHCPQLHTLNLQNSQIEPSAVCRFLEVCGARLKSLFFSFSHQTNGIMNSLTSGSCPELRVLELNVGLRAPMTELQIAIEALQASCPKLEVLRLLNLPWSPKSGAHKSLERPGFEELQELCLATTTYSFINDSMCKRLLRDSTKLRVLDIRGCYRLTAKGICEFPCPDLECLYFGMYCCSMNPSLPDSGCPLLTRRWQRSLQELDLTAQAYSEENLTQTLEILSREGNNDTLHSLNLTGTKVTSHSVRNTLSCCSALTHLDLTSCRNIPRGFKRAYRGREDIRQCLNTLTNYLEEEGE